jgi:hypothetical protein
MLIIFIQELFDGQSRLAHIQQIYRFRRAAQKIALLFPSVQ